VRHRGHYVWKKETSEYLIPTEVHGSKRSLHGVQQVETAATSTLAHVQQFAVASLMASVFELPLSDVTVVDGEKPRSGHVCRRGHVVRRHVVHDARSAHRHRLLSDEVSDMTRSSVTLPWLAPTPDDGAAIEAYVIRAARTPVTDVDARRAGKAADNRLHGRQPPRTSREPDRR